MPLASMAELDMVVFILYISLQGVWILHTIQMYFWIQADIFARIYVSSPYSAPAYCIFTQACMYTFRRTCACFHGRGIAQGLMKAAVRVEFASKLFVMLQTWYGAWSKQVAYTPHMISFARPFIIHLVVWCILHPHTSVRCSWSEQHLKALGSVAVQ